MGCFNKTGFFSHLPITYGDDIVLFVCANTQHERIDSTPIDVTGIGLTPIAMPFFGKYNDYGSIEDVVDDANHQYFTKKVGMTLEDFANLMHDHSGMSISYMEEQIEAIKNEERSENKVHYETVEDFEKGIKMLKNLFGFEPKKFEPRHGENDERIKKVYEQMYQYELRRYNNTSIVIIIDHKSVYDKMVEVGKNGYTDGWSWYKPVSPDEAFDFTVKLIKDNEDEIGNVNPLQFGSEGLVYFDLDVKDTDRKNMYLFFASHCILHDTVHIDDFDHCFYNGIGKGIEPMKEIAVNYVYFLKTFERTNTVFNYSPYHTQEVDYKRLIPVFEEILETLKRKARKYNSDEDE